MQQLQTHKSNCFWCPSDWNFAHFANFAMIFCKYFLHCLENRCSLAAQKLKFSIKDFFGKCDQTRRKLRIWSYLLKKSLMENFTFCAVSRSWPTTVLKIDFFTDILQELCLQTFGKYLRQILIFMWNSTIREKFNFCFSEDFYKYWSNFYFGRRTECYAIILWSFEVFHLTTREANREHQFLANNHP